MRFILFSDNFINTISEDRLNKLIKKKYKSGNNNSISEIFSNEEKRKLITLKNSNKDCRVQNDNPKTKLTFTDCLARNIASEVSEYLPLRKCDGLKGELKNKIIRVKKGIGCSSDFNESFMLHSQFVGLEVREVNDNRNTSSEYFDPEVKRWKWIDTSFRMQLVNKAGLILNSHNVSNQYLGDDLMFVDIYPLIDKKKFKNKNNIYNNIGSKGGSAYLLGNNIIEYNNFEKNLLKRGFPNSISQLISTSLGIRPKYIYISGRRDTFNANVLKIIIKSLFFIYLFINTSLIIWKINLIIKLKSINNKKFL